MLVFGDHSYKERGSIFAARLGNRARRTNAADLHDLRTLLIQAGQFEQAVADYAMRAPEIYRSQQTAEHITDRAAAAFYEKWANGNALAPPADSQIAPWLAALEDDLSTFLLPGDPPLEFKIPEGFAIYALYPEQYLVSISKWLGARHQNASTRILVVGIRSIGTTLSALCQVSLRARGYKATRVTVRPGGSPWTRKLDFAWPHVLGETAALIVDEG